MPKPRVLIGANEGVGNRHLETGIVVENQGEDRELLEFARIAGSIKSIAPFIHPFTHGNNNNHSVSTTKHPSQQHRRIHSQLPVKIFGGASSRDGGAAVGEIFSLGDLKHAPANAQSPSVCSVQTLTRPTRGVSGSVCRIVFFAGRNHPLPKITWSTGQPPLERAALSQAPSPWPIFMHLVPRSISTSPCPLLSSASSAGFTFRSSGSLLWLPIIRACLFTFLLLHLLSSSLSCSPWSDTRAACGETTETEGARPRSPYYNPALIAAGTVLTIFYDSCIFFSSRPKHRFFSCILAFSSNHFESSRS